MDTDASLSILRLLVPAVLAAQMLTGPGSSEAYGGPLIDPEVRAAVQGSTARVLVELRISGGIRPEAELGGAETVRAQREAISTAQAAALSRLQGSHFALARRYATVPLLGLEIGADALAALEAMGDLVSRVRPDVRLAPKPAGEEKP